MAARAASEPAPQGLLTDLATIDHKLSALLDEHLKVHHALPTYHDLVRHVHEITSAKHAVVEKFFNQDVYGVKLSEVSLKIDCLDSELITALEFARGEKHLNPSAKAHRITKFLEAGERCEKTLEHALSNGGFPPEGLLTALATIDQKLTALIKHEHKGHGLSEGKLRDRIHEIVHAKRALFYLAAKGTPSDEFFNQDAYGVKASEVLLQMDAVDGALSQADEHARTNGTNNQTVDADFGVAKYAIETLDDDLRSAETPPTLAPIHAEFTQSTFSTLYTENATGPDLHHADIFSRRLHYRWAVSIPADPGCASGFQANQPPPGYTELGSNQATWTHKDVSQGGACNHTGTTYDAQGRGHPGTVVVQVSNPDWTCAATYYGTQGDNGSVVGDGAAPQPCQRTH